eukprot:2361019-Prymnesium_polylepis.1
MRECAANAPRTGANSGELLRIRRKSARTYRESARTSANSTENFRKSVANPPTCTRKIAAYQCKYVQTHSRAFANLS